MCFPPEKGSPDCTKRQVEPLQTPADKSGIIAIEPKTKKFWVGQTPISFFLAYIACVSLW